MFLLSQKCRNARLTPFWVRVWLTVHIFWYALMKFLSLAVLKKIISGPEKILKKSGISKSWICGSPGDLLEFIQIHFIILYISPHSYLSAVPAILQGLLFVQKGNQFWPSYDCNSVANNCLLKISNVETQWKETESSSLIICIFFFIYASIFYCTCKHICFCDLQLISTLRRCWFGSLKTSWLSHFHCLCRQIIIVSNHQCGKLGKILAGQTRPEPYFWSFFGHF